MAPLRIIKESVRRSTLRSEWRPSRRERRPAAARSGPMGHSHSSFLQRPSQPPPATTPRPRPTEAFRPSGQHSLTTHNGIERPRMLWYSTSSAQPSATTRLAPANSTAKVDGGSDRSYDTKTILRTKLQPLSQPLREMIGVSDLFARTEYRADHRGTEDQAQFFDLFEEACNSTGRSGLAGLALAARSLARLDACIHLTSSELSKPIMDDENLTNNIIIHTRAREHPGPTLEILLPPLKGLNISLTLPSRAIVRCDVGPRLKLRYVDRIDSGSGPTESADTSVADVYRSLHRDSVAVARRLCSEFTFDILQSVPQLLAKALVRIVSFPGRSLEIYGAGVQFSHPALGPNTIAASVYKSARSSDGTRPSATATQVQKPEIQQDASTPADEVPIGSERPYAPSGTSQDVDQDVRAKIAKQGDGSQMKARATVAVSLSMPLEMLASRKTGCHHLMFEGYDKQQMFPAAEQMHRAIEKHLRSSDVVGFSDLASAISTSFSSTKSDAVRAVRTKHYGLTSTSDGLRFLVSHGSRRPGELCVRAGRNKQLHIHFAQIHGILVQFDGSGSRSELDMSVKVGLEGLALSSESQSKQGITAEIRFLCEAVVPHIRQMLQAAAFDNLDALRDALQSALMENMDIRKIIDLRSVKVRLGLGPMHKLPQKFDFRSSVPVKTRIKDGDLADEHAVEDSQHVSESAQDTQSVGGVDTEMSLSASRMRATLSSGAKELTSVEAETPNSDQRPPASQASKGSVLVALGSNMGDRLKNIEDACKLMNDDPDIRLLRTSAIYETDPMYVEDQDRFLNGVCEIDTSLPPIELLNRLQAIEDRLGRVKVIDKGPRTIDLDILMYKDVAMKEDRLIIPHPLIQEREFVLRPLCDLPMSDDRLRPIEALQQLGPGPQPLYAQTPINARIEALRPGDPKRQTRVMAILNTTPDSFSDGDATRATDREKLQSDIQSFIDGGATIIDVGGQSSRPNAPDITAEEEISRILPAIEVIRSMPSAQNVAISVDTYRASVAEAAIKAGADAINDISAGQLDTEMLPTIARLGCTYMLMHMRGTPATMQNMENCAYPQGLIPTLASEIESRIDAAQEAGIRRWRIILDPGIGFSKTMDQNLEILRDLPKLRDALPNYPWLIGSSRKGFIGKITGVSEPKRRGWGTAATVTAAVQGGADVVRVHDVREMADVVKMADAMYRV